MLVVISKWKYDRIVVIVRIAKTKENLVISRCCFAEDGKEMYKRCMMQAHIYCFAH